MASDETSPEPGQRPLESYFIYVGIAAVIGLLVMLILSVLGPASDTPTATTKSTNEGEGGLEAAKQGAARETDLSTCRSAFHLINDYLQQKADKRPSLGGTDERERLQQFFGLKQDELSELESPNFTLLDEAYLESCYVFRDAAHSLDVIGANGQDGKPLALTQQERVVSALAWSVRQMRIGSGGPGYFDAPNFPAPPLFAARRGRGSELERALVFLTLLQQVNRADDPIVTCLLQVPQRGTVARRVWACGVAFGKSDDLYLFDPRIGLPIPGPGGKGVATLAQVCKDDAILRQLDSDKIAYDITAELAGQAELTVVAPLSGLSKRMAWLQANLQSPAVRVNLAVRALADLDRLTSAARLPDGRSLRVVPWQEVLPNGQELSGPSLMRRFLPREEGGIDAERRLIFVRDLVPWGMMPPLIRDADKFPLNIDLGRKVADYFAAPFWKAVLQPQQPRDMILRGRIDMATPELTKELRQMQEFEQRQLPADINQQVEEWARNARATYSALFQLQKNPKADPSLLQDARVEEGKLWKENSRPLVMLIQSGFAEPRAAELTYQLGICTLQRAEGVQARIDLVRRTPGAKLRDEDLKIARKEWRDALGWWTRYGEEYKNGPGQAHARRLRLARFANDGTGSRRAQRRRKRGRAPARRGRHDPQRSQGTDDAERESGRTVFSAAVSVYPIMLWRHVASLPKTHRHVGNVPPQHDRKVSCPPYPTRATRSTAPHGACITHLFGLIVTSARQGGR